MNSKASACVGKQVLVYRNLESLSLPISHYGDRFNTLRAPQGSIWKQRSSLKDHLFFKIKAF